MAVIIVALLLLLRLLLMLFSSPILPISITAGYPGILVSLSEKSGLYLLPLPQGAYPWEPNYYLFLEIRLIRLILPSESTGNFNIYLPGVLQKGNCKTFNHSNAIAMFLKS